ncbi:ABC transporter permease [Nocardioides hungaricus]
MAVAWLRFLLGRLAGTALVLLVLSFGIYCLVYLAPGSVEQTLLGNRPATDATRAAIRAQYRLDDPLLVQYGRWLADALQGDLGTSIRSGEPVGSAISARAGLTLQLALLGTLFAVLLGIAGGVLAALRRGRAADQGIVVLSVAGLSAPPFAVGLLLLGLLAVRLGWFPVYGSGAGGPDRLWHLMLPAIALAVGGAGLLVRFTRTALVRELGQDYVVFARARGLGPVRVLRYALRNCAVPILTATGLVLTSILVGSVLVEIVFALPGLGSLLVDAVTFKDVPVVQGVALLLTALIALVNLVVDAAYAAADPRVSLVRRPR